MCRDARRSVRGRTFMGGMPSVPRMPLSQPWITSPRPDLQTRAAARLLEPQEHSMSGEQLFEQQDKCSRNKQAKLKRHTRMSSRKNTRRSRGRGNCEEQTNTTNRDARPLLALNVRGLPRS